MTGPRMFLKGNEALAFGALHAGLSAFYGYPITPSSEVPETLAREVGTPRFPGFTTFLQAASEVEAINMMIGSAATGARSMTATSGPGFSLMQEGISYAAATELPMLIVNVNRSGPGLGNLGPEQSDYFQATRGGGHGGYASIVLAPGSVPEMAAFPARGFALAFKYRTPVVILADSFLGQLKEDLSFPEVAPESFDTSWATTGARGSTRHYLTSLHLELADQSAHVERLGAKFREVARVESLAEEIRTDDAEVVFVAYGICARLAGRAVDALRGRGVRAGLVRPITLAPFPARPFQELVDRGVRRFLVVELNLGQMVDDVRLATEGRAEVRTLHQVGGLLPTTPELVRAAEGLLP